MAMKLVLSREIPIMTRLGTLLALLITQHVSRPKQRAPGPDYALE